MVVTDRYSILLNRKWRKYYEWAAYTDFEIEVLHQQPDIWRSFNIVTRSVLAILRCQYHVYMNCRTIISDKTFDVIVSPLLMIETFWLLLWLCVKSISIVHLKVLLLNLFGFWYLVIWSGINYTCAFVCSQLRMKCIHFYE